ncbi:TIGR02281 family clan AA aspartic protease [Hyphomonas sp. FCG-A18]|jgi:aspartyl protease family protein|uniref:TIGR02281 family clan AA aspartic protease n=1 Tax=Hyphomonas sp. FCG-A18 TaxID=3080019 RepID=UPI002B2AFF4B|nr:TIGR02281 family clan AA aspartic protease [Hyphomonas sp. FCG-A18]
MSASNFIGGMIVAGAIAGVVAVFLAPKFDESASTNTPKTNAATMTVTNTTAPDGAPLPNATRRSAVLNLKNDGHYWANVLVNKKATVNFMVDTGASVVALTYEDARRLGLKPDTLDYRWRISTAGGETMGASVVLDSLKVNQVHVRNVEAMVLRTDLEQSLLGMSFLSQLYAYEFRGERLILRQ